MTGITPEILLPGAVLREGAVHALIAALKKALTFGIYHAERGSLVRENTESKELGEIFTPQRKSTPRIQDPGNNMKKKMSPT